MSAGAPFPHCCAAHGASGGPRAPPEEGAAALVGQSPVHRLVPAHLCGREAEDGGLRVESCVAEGGRGWHGDAGQGGALVESPAADGSEASGESDAGEGGAATEGLVADGGEAGGKGGRWKRILCVRPQFFFQRGSHGLLQERARERSAQVTSKSTFPSALSQLQEAEASSSCPRGSVRPLSSS